MKFDQSSFYALYGLSLCELSENGITDELSSQVDFLMKMKNDKNLIYLHFLQAKIKKKSSNAVEHLLNICELKLNQLQNYPFSESFLLLLDPTLMLEVVTEYMRHIKSSKSSIHTSVCDILKLIVRSCSGSMESLLLLAKVQYINGDFNNAISNLEKHMNKTVDPDSEAYLLMAQIQIQLGYYDRASQSLEVRKESLYKTP